MKKRTFKVTTDYVTLSFVHRVERKFNTRGFLFYARDKLPDAAVRAMSEEDIVRNPRFKNTNLKIKNIEVGFRKGVNRIGCPAILITLYFDTYCNKIPFSLEMEIKKFVKNFDETLAPPLLTRVKNRDF